MEKGILRIDHSSLSTKGSDVWNKLILHIKNVRKYRGKIERRKMKIRRLYDK